MNEDNRLRKQAVLAFLAGLVLMAVGYGGLYYWFCR